MADVGDPTRVWAYGMAEPGWYVAKGVWCDSYARHLRSAGYRVARSVDKPTNETPEYK